MKDKHKTAVIAAVAIAALAAGGTAIAAAGGDDDDATETPITGKTLERAGAIALDRTQAGRGTTVLVQRPSSGELAVWARCRSGRFTQRGPAHRV